MKIASDKILEVLTSVGDLVATTNSDDDLLNRILDMAKGLFAYDNAIIRLINHDGTLLEAVASSGYGPAALDAISIGRGVMGRVALTGRPLLVEDVTTFADYIVGIPDAKSELAVPLAVQGDVIGVLNVESSERAFFSEDDIEPLSLFASQAATTIANSRLYFQLKKVSEQYHHLNQVNNRIVRNADIGIYTLDLKKDVVSWNPKMDELSGISEKDIVGKNIVNIFPNLEKEGVLAGIDRVLIGGTASSFELKHRDRYDDIRYQRRHVSSIREDGNICGCIVLVQDITENRQLSEQILRSEKLAEVGRLSAGIAHEINNPLSVIGYAAKLLADRDDLPPFEVELIDRIISETDRLAALTGGLLSFSRAGQDERTLVDVNDLVADTLKFIAYEIGSTELRVDAAYGVIPPVRADATRLKQVLLNLLKNAMHVLGSVGTISIETNVVDDMVTIGVSDSGCGVDESIRERIFEPFFTTKRETEGTGLGLYLCRKILREHGGDIRCAKGSMGGALFVLTLPAYLLGNEDVS